MRIVVCVKYVPDTAIKVKITPDRKAVDWTEVAFVVNPYDEFAVEEALQIKERSGGEVIVVGAGGERAALAGLLGQSQLAPALAGRDPENGRRRRAAGAGVCHFGL